MARFDGVSISMVQNNHICWTINLCFNQISWASNHQLGWFGLQDFLLEARVFPANVQVRFIKEVPVFAVTSSFSIIAYLWLLIIAAWLWESGGQLGQPRRNRSFFLAHESWRQAIFFLSDLLGPTHQPMRDNISDGDLKGKNCKPAVSWVTNQISLI